MTRLFHQNPDELKNFLKRRRFVFGVGDAKEKPEQAAVPEAEKFENRKQQARGEIDSIYESGKYDTYNFRTLPQEFKDHMRNNFGQWIDSNIAKYDKDKDSGINAAEYEEFKKMLNGKVSEILDRLIETKEKKKKQAIENKETAEQAKEAQERLEGVDTSKLNEANLENEDGCYTELLSYQKDFEKEAQDFSALAGVFSGAKEKADNANKSHHTGATAFGEMLVNWYEDIPEVKEAKAAKAQAVADFRTKLAEMKKRQKARQARGKSLNGAPEKIRGKVTAQYDEAKKKTREELDLAKKAEEENRLEKERLKKEMEENEKRRKSAQREYEMLLSRLREAQQRKEEVEKRTGEMKEATTGFEATAEAARKAREEQKSAGGESGAKSIRTERGKMSPEELEREARGAASKAREVTDELETGLDEADKAVGGMSGSAMVIQRKVADMIAAGKVMAADLTKCEKTGIVIDAALSGLDEHLKKLDTEEKQRLEQVDSLDSAIAETVIQVDTSNFELVKQGENYLKSLESMDVSGPGILDTAGAMIMGIPGVETAYNWSGDKLSGAWQWAKGAPVLGAVIEIAGYAGDGWVAAWDAIGDGLSWVGDKLHLGEAWDWMSEASKHLSIGNPTGNAAVDAILDTFSGGGLGTIIEVFAGVTEGAKGLVQGVGMMLQHPFETIRGLGGLLNHPGKIIDALIQKDKWSTESTSKIIGRAIFDVVATLTGGGATATSVKTAITAMKLGGMSAGKAILLGIKTFGKVFLEDIAKVTAGTVKGLIRLPVTLTRGVVDLVKWIARGGKKSPEAIRLATLEKTAKVGREAEALRELMTVRDNPSEFLEWLGKHPDNLDLAYKLVREEKAATKAVAKAGSSKPKKSEDAPPKAAPDDDFRAASADEATKPEGNRPTEAAPISGHEDTLQVSMEEMFRDRDTAPTRKERKGRDKVTSPTRKDRSGERIVGDEPTLSGIGRDAAVMERRKSEKIKARAKAREDAREAATEEIANAERRLLERTPDYKPKPLTPERMKSLTEVQEKIRGNEVFESVSKKLEDSLADLRKQHASELEGMSPSDPRYKEIRRSQLREEAKLDAHRLLEALPEDELALLNNSFADLNETMMERVLRQEYTVILDSERRPVRVYIADEINHGAFGMVNDVAYVVGNEKRIRTTGAIKRPRDMASLKKDSDFSNMSIAQLNDLLNSIEINFYNEARTFGAVKDFKNSEGLLQPRVISNDPAAQFIIYDKIDAGPGEPVRLSDRIDRGDNVEDILGFAADAMNGELNLAREGWFHLDIKPQNIFVGYDENGVLRGFMGDLSLNNLDDVADIRLIEVPSSKKESSKNFGVLKVNRSDFSKSLQIGTTPGYFSFEHVNKSFNWVKERLTDGGPIPESIMALPGNNAFAVTLDRVFRVPEMIDVPGGRVKVYRRFNEDVLPIHDRSAIIREIDDLTKRLRDENSGIDITTRQAEFRRIQKRIADARARDRLAA